jgi:signal transduction histidine kinase
MLEHLLNHAAQSVAGTGGARAGEEGVIRVSVSVSRRVSAVSDSGDGEWVHLVVSDTGPGFAQPGRVFEPSDSMGLEMGLGLSVCYGIVREHGGEISAFNLHPHGAAVSVELPVDAGIKKSGVGGARVYSASVGG